MQAAAKLMREYLQELCAQENSLLDKQNSAVTIGGEHARRLVQGTATSFHQSSDRTAEFQLKQLPEVLGAYNTFIANMEVSADVQEPEPGEEEDQECETASASVLTASVEMTAAFRSEFRRIVQNSVRAE
jgi:hypothetical protein